MPRNPTTGVFTRVSNSFSQPVFGTDIDPTDADLYFDDVDIGLNSLPLPAEPFVILTTGQSNFVLNPAFVSVPAQNAAVWNNTVDVVSIGTAFTVLSAANINMPASIASQIAKLKPTQSVYLINVAFQARPISHWLPATGAPDIYQNCVDNVVPALAAIGATKIDMFFWWQGEANTIPITSTYSADFASVMTRFWGNSWFPQETPVVICSIASTAISSNADGDKFNDVLLGCVNADPDKRRFVYTAELASATYWDAGNPGHMTAQGYYSAGIMAANIATNGPGRDSLKSVVVDPASGQIILGNPTYVADATAKVTFNANATQAVLPAPVGGSVVHITGADAASPIVSIDSFGGFVNFVGRRANGTNAAKTGLVAGDLMVGLGAQGYHSGSAYVSGNKANILFRAAETWSSTANGCYAQIFTTPATTATAVEAIRIQPSGALCVGATAIASDPGAGNLSISGGLFTKSPVTLTGTSGTIGGADSSTIFNASGTFTSTLPAASTNTGKWLTVKSIVAQAINSASSNIVPRAGGAAGTVLLTSGAGNWAILQSDGTNWIIMAGS